MSIMKITGVSPLYSDYPKVFWWLWDADPKDCTVDKIMQHFPELTPEKATEFLELWQASDKISAPQPSRKSAQRKSKTSKKEF